MPFTPFLAAISFSIMLNSSCLRIKILSHTSQADHVRIALKMFFHTLEFAEQGLSGI